MVNKKTSAVSVDSSNMQTSEYQPIRDHKRSDTKTVLEKLKNPMQMALDFALLVDAEDELRKAISDAVRHDAENSKLTTVKETKQRRRDIIVDAIMKHGRNLDS